jgi:hypothetical protein
MVIVTGAGPQKNVITPPAATAATTASDVQLAGVPSPITRVGFDVSSAAASAGIAASPSGFPGGGRRGGTGGAASVAGGVCPAGTGVVDPSGAGGAGAPHPARISTAVAAASP